MSALLVRMLWD